MTNQTEHSEPKPCHTGEPEEDRVSVREASSVEPAMYVLLFIVFFTTLLAIRTVLDVNDSTKTVPDIIHSLVTRHAGNATVAAIGLSVMTVQMWKFSASLDAGSSEGSPDPLPGSPVNESRRATGEP